MNFNKVGILQQQEKKTLDELHNTRKMEKDRRDMKASKIEKRQADADWQTAKEVITEFWNLKVVEPIEQITGINHCVPSHSKEDKYYDEDCDDEDEVEHGSQSQQS
mmetsp:Transcript_10610/g.35504  ORF Transcript_10610/g.35504 Transcript_10610/m.35504 type:complete len:106 (-) Transcript_10610:1354-1671(-)